MNNLPVVRSPWRIAILIIGFTFLYAPMLMLVIYSFNSSKLVTVWAGWSTRWYSELFHDDAMMSAVGLSLTIAALAATMACVLGTIAALVMVSYFGSARSDLGRDLLMPALTAAVLGGANIYGGSGSVVGTALAALLVGYLQQGLQMVGIPNQVSSALSGALLVVVVMGRSLSLHREWVRSLFRKLSGA